MDQIKVCLVYLAYTYIQHVINIYTKPVGEAVGSTRSDSGPL